MTSSKQWLSNPDNIEKLRISKRNYRLRNRDKLLAKQREVREENRDAYNAYMREYHQKNKTHRVKYINAFRRGKLSNATPIWANKKEIRLFYKNCPPGFHVDHIIPLNGNIVSGLHVTNNLQYLPATENIKKGNKFCLT